MKKRTSFKKALITGAAGDLSNELCSKLAEMGTQIVAIDISREGLDALRERFEDRVSVDTYVADMCDHEGLEKVLLEIADRHPDIDVLISTAGIDIPQRAEKLDWRIAKRHFDINTTANYVLFAVFLPRFIERNEGHVVSIISLGGLVGTPYEHAYNASKSAMHRMMDGLRIELQDSGVDFTSVFPSFLAGKMVEGNAFKIDRTTTMSEAANIIMDGILAGKPHIKFPLIESLKADLLGILPVGLQDKLTSMIMDKDFD